MNTKKALTDASDTRESGKRNLKGADAGDVAAGRVKRRGGEGSPKKPQAEQTEAEGAAQGGTAKWILSRRLEFIDYRLAVDGRLNRQDMATYFGISIPQASLDLAYYIKLVDQKYPGRKNFRYDHRLRSYLRTEEFSPLYPEITEPSEVLNELLANAKDGSRSERSYLGFIPNVGVSSFEPPKRVVSPSTLRNLLDAMHHKMALHITYMSLNRNNNTDHLIAPHAFAYDGLRWHVRAYCYDRHAFRDYVLSRILHCDVPNTLAPPDRFPNPRSNGFDEVGTSSEDDEQWNEIVNLQLAANPALPQRTKRVIEHDYGLERDGYLIYPCRRALLFYALRHMRLTPAYSALPPEERQLVLVNEAEVLSKLED